MAPRNPPSGGSAAAARQALAQSEARLALATEAASLGVWDWDLDTDHMVYSTRAKAIFGWPPDQDVTLALVRAATHPDDLASTWPMVQRALDPAIRERMPYEYRILRPDGEVRWVVAHGIPLFERRGGAERAVRYLGAIQDITEARKVADDLRATQARLETAMAAGRMAIWELASPNLVVASPQFNALFGLEVDAATRLDDLRARYLPGEREKVHEVARAALENGQREFEAQIRYARSPRQGEANAGPRGEETGWLLVRGEIVRNSAGGAVDARGVLVDITAQKAAEEALRESEERLRALADNLPGGMIYQITEDEVGGRRFTYISNSCERITGVAAEAAMADAELLYRRLHPADAALLAGPSAASPDAPEGEARGIDVEVRARRPDGDYQWFRIASAPRRTASGQRVWDGIQIDVDARHRAEEALLERSRTLEILNRAGARIAADLDLQSVLQTVTAGGVELTGAQFGAFFEMTPAAEGGGLVLHALAGSRCEGLADLPTPRATEIFGPTVRGEGVVRSADITLDPRYGHNPPLHGIPEGHPPVHSYLAVPVRARGGEVLGGLFFGHEERGVFDAGAEGLLAGLAAQSAVAIDNARLFAQLQRLNAGLEEQVAREVAERLRAEEALRQAQKMEAVGQLTGGVAHDFNNLLTLIIGGLDMIRRAAPGEEARVRRAVDMAMHGAERASSLTTRLLAFSRRQPLDPKPLELNRLISALDELLQRTLGETVEIETVLAPRLWTIEADQNQLESALLNLALNARDAMPAGGKLTLETANTDLDESYQATDSEVIPGQYAVVSVSDTGCGMDAVTLERAFEPFFTTKEVDKGTGLGLSMVYGFVKQSGGHVTLYSEPGEGTTVKLYFPRYRGETAPTAQITELEGARGRGKELILVVEDNDALRAFSAQSLRELGYRVLEAREAGAALALVADHPVELLFTDVVLPGLSGRQLAEQAAQIRPGLRVLFTTGYARNAIVHHGRLDPGVRLISKPFTLEQLAARIRDLLDRPAD